MGGANIEATACLTTTPKPKPYKTLIDPTRDGKCENKRVETVIISERWCDTEGEKGRGKGHEELKGYTKRNDVL